ncbi:MAG: hypothetical protein QOJ16_5041, partial [Acidobacteriota bacterium]|nr:hypothetical protein [Acidobacteriota bacterium]
HSGTIGFETRPGEGTTFFFDLPEWGAEPAVEDDLLSNFRDPAVGFLG